MHLIYSSVVAILAETWDLLQDASVYILIGLLAGGMLKFFLSPRFIVAHLGTGRFSSVLKAALLGIPLPLCSCGVLPTAASLKRMGASNGATTAFLISTPESGVDSIAISWALLDPLLTISRPVAALITALVAGFSENLLHPPKQAPALANAGMPGPAQGNGADTAYGTRPQGIVARIQEGGRYALVELWGDLVGPFFLGLLFAGIVAVLVPDDFLQAYLGGGLSSMLVMLLFGIPLYICATASTPIAASFLLKGVSPGAVLVFLLVGPATNIASIAVLVRLLGKRSTGVYLASIAVVSVLCGLTVDLIYASLGISARAVVGRAGEITPDWLRTSATLIILLLSIQPLARIAGKWFGRRKKGCACPPQGGDPALRTANGPQEKGCGCGEQCSALHSPVQGNDSAGSGPEQ